MNFQQLPKDEATILKMKWSDLEPYADELEKRSLNKESVAQWLLDWTTLSDTVSEIYSRLYLATSVNTIDKQAEESFKNFLDNLLPESRSSFQKLKVVIFLPSKS